MMLRSSQNFNHISNITPKPHIDYWRPSIFDSGIYPRERFAVPAELSLALLVSHCFNNFRHPGGSRRRQGYIRDPTRHRAKSLKGNRPKVRIRAPDQPINYVHFVTRNVLERVNLLQVFSIPFKQKSPGLNTELQLSVNKPLELRLLRWFLSGTQPWRDQ